MSYICLMTLYYAVLITLKSK